MLKSLMFERHLLHFSDIYHGSCIITTYYLAEPPLTHYTHSFEFWLYNGHQGNQLLKVSQSE